MLFIYSLTICNNVRFEKKDNKSVFNASSPDEIAMVEFFEELGFKFWVRNDEMIEFIDNKGKIKSFYILKLFPF